MSEAPLPFTWLWLLDAAATFAGLVWVASLSREQRAVVKHAWKERLTADAPRSIRVRYGAAQAWAYVVFAALLWHGAGHLYLIGRHCGLLR